MAPRRARIGLAHALAWNGWGAGAALIAEQPLPPSTLALGGAVAAAVAAFGMLLPQRRSARAMRIGALGLSVVAVIGAAVASVTGAFWPALLPWLGGAAGAFADASLRSDAADPRRAPGIRIAPTLLALAAGAALVAGAAALALPVPLVLAAIAALQLAAAILLARAPEPAAELPRPASAAPPARLLPLLALAAAGAAALIVLRPALSAIGTDDPQPAGPAALVLLIGGLVGPPLARLVDRLGLERGGPLLATLSGTAALIAPVARPGTLDLVAAAVLGVALAAVVALAELARRSGVALRPRGAAVLLLAGALGSVVAGLLLSAVPVPDVVLGASIACLVAGLGAWAPEPRERVSAG